MTESVSCALCGAPAPLDVEAEMKPMSDRNE